MKQVRVTSVFIDKFHKDRTFRVGEVLSFDDERAADVVARGLAEYVVEPEKAKEEEVKAPTLFEEQETVAEPEKEAVQAEQEVEAVSPVTEGEKKVAGPKGKGKRR